MTALPSNHLRGKPLSAERACRGGVPALSLPEAPAGACVFESLRGAPIPAAARDSLPGGRFPRLSGRRLSRRFRAKAFRAGFIKIGRGEQCCPAPVVNERIGGKVPQRVGAVLHFCDQFAPVHPSRSDFHTCPSTLRTMSTGAGLVILQTSGRLQ